MQSTDTMGTLVWALGGHISPTAVFTSFMLASVFRSLGIAPGGLGSFEAASVLTLCAAGCSLPIALSATMLFRGLSFWLPMLPGFWLSRRIMRPRAAHHTRQAQLESNLQARKDAPR
jgi:P-type Mg2+ transporter